MYNPKNVFGMDEVKVHKDKGVKSYGAKAKHEGRQDFRYQDARRWRCD